MFFRQWQTWIRIRSLPWNKAKIHYIWYEFLKKHEFGGTKKCSVYEFLSWSHKNVNSYMNSYLCKFIFTYELIILWIHTWIHVRVSKWIHMWVLKIWIHTWIHLRIYMRSGCSKYGDMGVTDLSYDSDFCFGNDSLAKSHWVKVSEAAASHRVSHWPSHWVSKDYDWGGLQRVAARSG